VLTALLVGLVLSGLGYAYRWVVEEIRPITTDFKPDARVQCETGDLSKLLKRAEGELVEKRDNLQLDLARRARLCAKDESSYGTKRPLELLKEIAQRHADCFVYMDQVAGDDNRVAPAFGLIDRTNPSGPTPLCLANLTRNDENRWVPTDRPLAEGTVLCVPGENFVGPEAAPGAGIPACPESILKELGF
jgi:hypothetical protein